MRRMLGWVWVIVVLGWSPPAGAQVKWDLVTSTGSEHPVTKLYKEFAEDVAQRTQGRLVITIRSDGELPIKATEAFKATSSGRVALAQAYFSYLSGDLPLATIAGLPFLVRSPSQLAQIYPIIERRIEGDLERAGVKVLLWLSWPEVVVFGRGEPVREIADFIGRKVRVSDAKQATMISRLDGSPLTLAAPEVADALAKGTADALCATALGVVAAQWQNAIRWGWLGPVSAGGPEYLLMSRAAYDGLEPPVRAALDAAAADWGARMTARLAEAGRSALELLKTRAKIEMTAPNDAMLGQLTDRMQGYWNEWAKKQGPAAEQALKEIREVLKR